MSDYSFNNGKFSVVVSNIKASIYDVVSAISVKLFELGENGQSKLGEELERELKELIQSGNQITSRISKIDKMINLEQIEESSLIDVDSSKDDSIDNVKLSPKEIKIGNIERDDEEVSISSQALANLMDDSATTTEVDMDDEQSPALEDIYNVGDSLGEEKVDAKPVIAPTVDEEPVIAPSVEEKPVITPTGEERPMITSIDDSQAEETDKPLEGVVSVEEETPETKEVPNIDLSNVAGVVEDKPIEEEKPVLSEAEESIERQRKEANTRKISYIIDKEGKDATRAILVTSAQFDKF